MRAIWSELVDRIGSALTRRRFAACARSARILGSVRIRGRGSVRVGERVVLDGRFAPIELHAITPEAIITLDDDVRIGPGTSIEAIASVSIGARARLDRFCKVMDTHFHQTSGDRQQRAEAHPVTIEEDTDVGPSAILTAGAHLERGVRVCPASMVTRRVRAGATVRGSPATVVRP